MLHNISRRLQDGFFTLVVPNFSNMTYKIKSLIYLSCFVVASFIYYGIEQEDKFQNQILSEELVETEFEDDLESEKLQEEILNQQE